jgi:hypothetical protein
MKTAVFLHDLRASLKMHGKHGGISDQAIRRRLALAKIKPHLLPCGRQMRAAITVSEASQIRQAFFAKHRRAT